MGTLWVKTRPRPELNEPDWAIQLSEAGFAYPGAARQLFSGLSLALDFKSRIAIIGPSGSGKTSLIRVIAGLATITTGKAIRSEPPPRIGLLPQDDISLPWRSVWRNLRLVSDSRLGVTALTSILSSLGLPPDTFADRLPGELSGGERRRLGLAMVLAAQPDLILLDEAGSSLDERTRFRIVDEIILAVENRTVGLIAITHDLEEALLLAKQIILFDGKGGIAQRQVLLPERRTSELRFTPDFQAQRAEIAAITRIW